MRTLPLGDVATYLNGKPFKPSDWEEAGIPIIRIQNLNDSTKPYNYYSRPCEERYMVRKGDVLIAWSGTLGVHEWNGPDAFLNQHIFKVVFDKEEVDKRYFIYAVDQLLQRVDKFMHGSTLTHITKKDFDPLPFVLPPLPAQRRIAAVLVKAQALVANDKRTLAVYDQLAKSLFREMFGDPVIQTASLGDYCKLITKGESPGWQGFDYQEEGVLFVTSENVGWGKMEFPKRKYIPQAFHDKLRRSKLELDDVLINLVGASIGRVAMATSDCVPANINQAVATVRVDSTRLSPVYLMHCLLSEKLQRLITGNVVESARANISLSDLRELKIPLPSNQDQRKFVRTMEKLAAQRELSETSLRRSEGLFGSLLQQAFSGGFGS